MRPSRKTQKNATTQLINTFSESLTSFVQSFNALCTEIKSAGKDCEIVQKTQQNLVDFVDASQKFLPLLAETPETTVSSQGVIPRESDKKKDEERSEGKKRLRRTVRLNQEKQRAPRSRKRNRRKKPLI